MVQILVSACLIGEPVRYNGKALLLEHPQLRVWSEEGRLLAVCPEVLGGLCTPRSPSEIRDGDGNAVLQGKAIILNSSGDDMSQYFITGARKALSIAVKHQINTAILADGSPSCGSTYIYNGQFDGTRIAKDGVTAALFRQHNIRVFSHLQIDAAEKYVRQLENRTASVLLA